MSNTAQNKVIDKVDRGFRQIAIWSIKLRWLIVLLTISLLMVGFHFASKARSDNSMDTFFRKDDPAYVEYKRYLDDFVSDEVIYILYRAKDKAHGPFDLEVMRVIAELTETLAAEVPFVREVTSLANVEFMHPVGKDDIVIDDLLMDFPKNQQQLSRIKQSVMEKPLYVDYLINQAADHAAIIIQMERTSADKLEDIIYDPERGTAGDNLYPVVSNKKLREITSRPEFQAHGIEYFFSGDVPMNSAYIQVMLDDVLFINLVALTLIVLLSLFLFRATLAGIFGPVMIVLISIVLTVGLLGFLDWPMGQVFGILPTLICAVGIAQSVHILMEYQRKLGESETRSEAVKKALFKVGTPCLMAAVTTALGFAVMTVSEIKALAEFGMYAPFGIMATFVLSVSLLVVLLSGNKPLNHEKKKPPVAPFVMRLVEATIRANHRFARPILIVSALLLIVALIGVNQVRNDFNFLKEFKPHVEWRQHTELIEDKMGGTLRLSYLIDTGVAEGIKNRDLLLAIDQFQKHINQHPLVKKSLALTDIIKDLNQTFHQGDKEYYRIPDQQELIAQYFLVYEVSGGEELEEFASLDNSRTVIELQVEIEYASQIKAMLNEFDNYLANNPMPNANSNKTGIGLLWVKMAEYIGDTQMASYTLVFLMIAAVMMIAFGSIKLALLCMIPNLAPVILALGALGWLNMPLDYMKVLLATIAIGIAVDDTIHLVTRFRAQFYATGNYKSAMENSLRDVGPALIITSIILITAFCTYLLSNTTVMASFGVLIASTIFIALIADLFMMPILLMKSKPFGDEFEPATAQSERDSD